jgi:thiamine biosynthesis protein ThiC
MLGGFQISNEAEKALNNLDHEELKEMVKEKAQKRMDYLYDHAVHETTVNVAIRTA